MPKKISKITLTAEINALRHQNGRNRLGILKFFAVFAALTAMFITLPTEARAEDGRIHISFLKADYGSGSGYLFYKGQKFGLGISSTKIGRVWITTIDLIGTASNLHSAADIIGTYTAAEPEAGMVRRAKAARLENPKGVILEIRAVNLNRWFTLDLSGMTIKNLGWQPVSE